MEMKSTVTKTSLRGAVLAPTIVLSDPLVLSLLMIIARLQREIEDRGQREIEDRGTREIDMSRCCDDEMCQAFPPGLVSYRLVLKIHLFRLVLPPKMPLHLSSQRKHQQGFSDR